MVQPIPERGQPVCCREYGLSAKTTKAGAGEVVAQRAVVDEDWICAVLRPSLDYVGQPVLVDVQ